MARAQKLKVFRTPIGFHDAYVAASSQKAALEAWGADSNLFASGSAELVEDPELTSEPLARPGQVVKRLRGTLAEHVAALPKRDAKPAPAQPTGKRAQAGASTKPPPKPKPRPSRAALDGAEARLAQLEERHAAAMADVTRRQAELERERRDLEVRQEREQARLRERADAAREKYEQAMRAWRAD